MEPLDKIRHGWAFKEGDLQKRIFSIEMFGSLLLIKAIMDNSHETDCRLPIPIITDNQANALAMLANKAKKWPGAAILMEISLTIHLHQTSLAPSFVHRESNEWADQLSKMDDTGF